jgi:hypothetical protein
MGDMKKFVEGQLVGEKGRTERCRGDSPFNEHDKSVVTDHTRKVIDLDMYSIRASYVL